MRTEVALRLNALDAAFYQGQARSFSDTRHAAWPGWERCLAAVGEEPAAARVLDVAAGNLRFARFLADRWPHACVAYDAVDSCPDLMRASESPRGWGVGLYERDLVSDLLLGGDGSAHGASAAAEASPADGGGHPAVGALPPCGDRERPAAGAPDPCPSGGPDPYDLVVCFGFAHHVPTAAARERLVRGLLRHTAPGGVCCVSLWRFMGVPSLARKAHATTAVALPELGLSEYDLDEGDWLLGWQGVPHAYRYCHSFSDAEVDVLARQDGASLEDRFLSDGRTGALNAYLVWRKR